VVDQRLFPLAPFATKEAQEKYPMTDAGEQVSVFSYSVHGCIKAAGLTICAVRPI